VSIRPYSSRRQPLDQDFLVNRLRGAIQYDRIAGYFRSSLLEVAGEALENLEGKIRIVCNSDLQPADVDTARLAEQSLRQSWCAGEPEKLGDSVLGQTRFRRLYQLLASGKLEVRVLPDPIFGLIHGKAGVIRYADGRATSFLGSVNESLHAWRLNYELLWEDDSDETVAWVQSEFDELWNHPKAVPLPSFVIEDIERISKRRVIAVDGWNDDPQLDAASAVIETPVYRKEFGLWAHQKYFVKLAFDAHRHSGARFVLADQVGLGKTVQLASAALLMALSGSKGVLILVPKPLAQQWQDELRDLLDIPSAIWTGKAWVDEQGIEHPAIGPESVKKCPRRFGIVSQGLITRGSEVTEHLKSMQYECVIVDESHRARRRKISPDELTAKAEVNNLLSFIYAIGDRTRSMLLATATPIQLHPIEAWDLLSALSSGTDSVLGDTWSPWRRPADCLPIVTGEAYLPDEFHDAWEWIRNPFPPSSEGNEFERFRSRLQLGETPVIPGSAIERVRGTLTTLANRIADGYGENRNPFIRLIVRRTRQYLENTINPETGEPFLKPVRVVTFRDGDNGGIDLPLYLREAYEQARQFCQLVGKRAGSAGFLKTLLLRRIGSSIYAGKETAELMLHTWGLQTSAGGWDAILQDLGDADDEDDEAPTESIQKEAAVISSEIKQLTPAERGMLQSCLDALIANQERDPKFAVVCEYLFDEGWLKLGCIIFSQYFDSVWWLANELSKERIPDEPIGVYAGAARSGILLGGQFTKTPREAIKAKVKTGEIRLIIGTDAASEGLNLQRLGTLINLDLPWNPTRLEQRKGRIQRIGQVRDTVFVANLRYRDSVEDDVHRRLSQRLRAIYDTFGQIPDVLEAAWVAEAMGNAEEGKKLIEQAASVKHPFDQRYERIENVEWETCTVVLDRQDRHAALSRPWK
jgi:superfamily II DNA or RNA helicase